MFISYFTPKNSSLLRFKIEIQCRNLKNQYFVKCLLLRVTFNNVKDFCNKQNTCQQFLLGVCFMKISYLPTHTYLQYKNESYRQRNTIY